MKQSKLLTFVKHIILAVLFLSLGYYLGAEYGTGAFKTPAQKALEIETVENQLAESLDRGEVSNVGGRILVAHSGNLNPGLPFVILADETLGVIYNAVGGFVERNIRVSDNTLIVKEEISEGPHFYADFDELKPGQFVTVYFAKNDFREDNAIAKEIIIHEYIAIDEDIASKTNNPLGG